MTARAIISAARTTIYANVTGAVAWKGPVLGETLNAFLAGAVCADFATWLIRSIALFPSFVMHGVYDAAVNLIFAWLIFGFFEVDMAFHDGEAMAAGFLGFGCVLAVKMVYYAAEFIEDEF